MPGELVKKYEPKWYRRRLQYTIVTYFVVNQYNITASIDANGELTSVISSNMAWLGKNKDFLKDYVSATVYKKRTYGCNKVDCNIIS